MVLDAPRGTESLQAMSSPHSQFGRRPQGSAEAPGVIRLSRAKFLGMAALLGVTSLWSAGLTGFVVFRDDLSARLIARQVESQYAYEERIAALRAHVDRLASRQMLDQDSVEARVAEVMSRQAELETRNAMVATLAQSVGMDAGVSQARKTMPAPVQLLAPTPEAPPPPPPITSFAPTAPKPLPVFETLRGGDGLRSSGLGEEPLKRRVSSLGQSLSRMERLQFSALDHIASRSRSRVQRLRSVMTEAGVDPERIAPTAIAKDSAVGGPLVPVTAADAANFESVLARANQLVQAEQRLARASRRLPLRHPLGQDAPVTSTFGVRSDPFTRAYAMHTGIDFRADHGALVRATGAGVVAKADYAGGYGNMVEVDHGNGLSTRYAHMSAIMVEEGQRIEPGAAVGRVGSTGRSTGAHLHYETRVTGDAADPTKFLRIGGRNRDLF
jgi:murein DD-endopeptidase MepM/ murein hydrolase activator NlpD